MVPAGCIPRKLDESVDVGIVKNNLTVTKVPTLDSAYHTIETPLLTPPLLVVERMCRSNNVLRHRRRASG